MLQFMKYDNVDAGSAIEQFKKEKPNVKAGYIVTEIQADKNITKYWLVYKGIYFAKVPGIRALQDAATDYFYDNLRKISEYKEYCEGADNYITTRDAAINEVMSNWYILDIEKGTVCKPTKDEPSYYKKVCKKKGLNVWYETASEIKKKEDGGFERIIKPSGKVRVFYDGKPNNNNDSIRVTLPTLSGPWEMKAERVEEDICLCPQCGKYNLFITDERGFREREYSGICISCGCGLSVWVDDSYIYYDERIDMKGGGRITYEALVKYAIRVWNRIRIGADDNRNRMMKTDNLTMIGEVIKMQDNIAIVKMPIPKPEIVEEDAQVIVLCPLEKKSSDISVGCKVSIKLENTLTNKIIKQKIVGRIVDVLEDNSESEKV